MRSCTRQAQAFVDNVGACPGATLPVRRKRRTQVTVLIPTPNRDAASRRDRPPSQSPLPPAREDQRMRLCHPGWPPTPARYPTQKFSGASGTHGALSIRCRNQSHIWASHPPILYKPSAEETRARSRELRVPALTNSLPHHWIQLA